MIIELHALTRDRWRKSSASGKAGDARSLVSPPWRRAEVTETSKKASGDTRRPRVMPDVTKALASDIFSGRYPAGSSLPTENELGVEYGVSRTVIREALKVL